MAYRQLTRDARAGKHEAVARWLEQVTGERADDIADVIAHHYVTALDLSEEIGAAESAALLDPAIRYLSLAGDRAMPLSVPAAEAHYREAARRVPEGYSARAEVLESWGEALIQSGRARQAAQVLEQAAETLRQNGCTLRAAAAFRRASDAHAYYADGPDPRLDARPRPSSPRSRQRIWSGP